MELAELSAGSWKWKWKFFFKSRNVLCSFLWRKNVELSHVVICTSNDVVPSVLKSNQVNGQAPVSLLKLASLCFWIDPFNFSER